MCVGHELNEILLKNLLITSHFAIYSELKKLVEVGTAPFGSGPSKGQFGAEFFFAMAYPSP